jgi:hypothetical protein
MGILNRIGNTSPAPLTRNQNKGDYMRGKWRVEKTRSKLRWVAWRVRQKKRTGKVFETWQHAFMYACAMFEVDKKCN